MKKIDQPVRSHDVRTLQPGVRSTFGGERLFTFGTMRDAVVNEDTRALREKGRIAAENANTLARRKLKAQQSLKRLTEQRDALVRQSALLKKGIDKENLQQSIKKVQDQINELRALVS